MSSTEIIVTGNVKARRQIDSTETDFVKVTRGKTIIKAKPINYGITDELSNVILDTVCKSELFIKNNFNVVIVEEALNPIQNNNSKTMHQKASDHSSRQAESKTLAYCEKMGEQLLRIGISKNPCLGCYSELDVM